MIVKMVKKLKYAHGPGKVQDEGACLCPTQQMLRQHWKVNQPKSSEQETEEHKMSVIAISNSCSVSKCLKHTNSSSDIVTKGEKDSDSP